MILAFCALLWTAIPVEPPRLEVLVTAAGGEVRLLGADPHASVPTRLDEGLWVPAGEGQKIEIAPGGEAQVLCPDLSCFVMRASQVIGPNFCAEKLGEACEVQADLPQQRQAKLRLDAHGVYIQGSLDLLGDARGDRERLFFDPFLISPRCPEEARQVGGCADWLAEPTEILFVAVDGVRQYRLRLKYPTRQEQLRLEAAELDCAPWPEWPQLRVCRVPWPASWRLPADGRTLYLDLEAFTDERRPSRQRTRMAKRSDGESSDWLLAREAYSEEERLLPEGLALLSLHLPSEVIARLAHRAALQPELDLVLAQAYLETDLPELARVHFCRASLKGRLAEAPLMIAEAALGLARSDMELDRPDEAIELLTEAAAIYRQLKITDRLELTERLQASLAARPQQ